MTYMTNQDKEWENYLLSIGVTNLNNQTEIEEKLDKVERENPAYEANTLEAFNELDLFESTPITDIRAWLESLGN